MESRLQHIDITGLPAVHAGANARRPVPSRRPRPTPAPPRRPPTTTTPVLGLRARRGTHRPDGVGDPRHQRTPVAGGRLRDIAQEEDAHLAASPRHEREEPPFRATSVGLDARRRPGRRGLVARTAGQVRRHETSAPSRGRRQSRRYPPGRALARQRDRVRKHVATTAVDALDGALPLLVELGEVSRRASRPRDAGRRGVEALQRPPEYARRVFGLNGGPPRKAAVELKPPGTRRQANTVTSNSVAW